MKRMMLVTIIAAVVLVAAGPAFAGIDDSPHDLVTRLTTTNSEICIVCHAPHRPTPGTKPLWNHAVPAASGYTMYGTTLSGQTADTDPNTPSLRCLACHDGVSAMDNYGGTTDGSDVMNTDDDAASSIIGKTLTDMHPISVAPSSDLNSIPSEWLYDDGGTDKIECSSCHDPHEYVATTNEDFLRVANADSALCLTCHTDK